MEFTGLHPLKDEADQRAVQGHEAARGARADAAARPEAAHPGRAGGRPGSARPHRAARAAAALADQGKAVLISSHILTELAEICDTCAIIEQGRLLATGKVADLLAQSQARRLGQRELTMRLAVGAEARGGATRGRSSCCWSSLGWRRWRVEPGALRVRLELEPGADADAGGRGGGAAAGGAGGGGRAGVRLQPPGAEPRGCVHDGDEGEGGVSAPVERPWRRASPGRAAGRPASTRWW